jgi:hypothetical protein
MEEKQPEEETETKAYQRKLRLFRQFERNIENRA